MEKSSVADFNFNIAYYQMDTEINIGVVTDEMGEINSCVQLICGQGPAEICSLVNLQLVMPQQYYNQA